MLTTAAGTGGWRMGVRKRRGDSPVVLGLFAGVSVAVLLTFWPLGLVMLGAVWRSVLGLRQ